MSDGTSFRRASAGDMTGSPAWTVDFRHKVSPARASQQDAGPACQLCYLMTVSALRGRNCQQAGNAAPADIVDAREHHVIALDFHQHRRGQTLAVELAERHRKVGGVAVPADRAVGA